MTRSPCIGWEADPPCPTYGPMHGCALPDGHLTKPHGHICACGRDLDGNQHPALLVHRLAWGRTYRKEAS